jgi:hypothetical protein
MVLDNNQFNNLKKEKGSLGGYLQYRRGSIPPSPLKVIFNSFNFYSANQMVEMGLLRL